MGYTHNAFGSLLENQFSSLISTFDPLAQSFNFEEARESVTEKISGVASFLCYELCLVTALSGFLASRSIVALSNLNQGKSKCQARARLCSLVVLTGFLWLTSADAANSLEKKLENTQVFCCVSLLTLGYYYNRKLKQRLAVNGSL